MNILCFLKTFWRTWGEGIPSAIVSGHDWLDEEEHDNCTVTISRCEVCGEQEISWYENRRPPSTI